jgi:hypothetical protein
MSGVGPMGAPAAGMPAPELGGADASSGSRRTVVKIVAGIVVVAGLAAGGWFGWHTLHHPAATPVAHSQSAPPGAVLEIPTTPALV